MKNKTIIRFGFSDIQNNQGSARVINLSLRLQLISPIQQLFNVLPEFDPI